MSGWRHIWHDGDACMGHEGKFLCGCTTPTPDPTSPCGYEGCDGETAHWSWTEPGTLTEPGAYCQHEERWDCHPYVPTLCVCGHPIEAVP